MCHGPSYQCSLQPPLVVRILLVKGTKVWGHSISSMSVLCFIDVLLIDVVHRTMNGLDPGALTAIASPRTVSPPGMLPLSVWQTVPEARPPHKSDTLQKRRGHSKECVSVCVRETEMTCLKPVWQIHVRPEGPLLWASRVVLLTSVLTRSHFKPAKRQRSGSDRSFCVSVFSVSHNLKEV